MSASCVVCLRDFACKSISSCSQKISVSRYSFTYKLAQNSYEIHSSVFLYKAHASGAIPQSRYAHTISLIQRFIAILQTIAINEQHITSRYARLLHQLWFQRPHSGLEHAVLDKTGNRQDADEAFAADDGSLLDPGYGTSLFDDVGFGMDTLDGMEAVDGFFAMPPAFSYDLSMFLRPMEAGGLPAL